MTILYIVVIAFILLEISNVLAMYFIPGTKFANSVGVFNAWDKSKKDPEVHSLVKYLVNWVAGTKLIFILLLIVMLYSEDATAKFSALIVLATTSALFYWRLFPLIRKMDKNGEIQPRGYSKTLGLMILVLIIAFLVAYFIRL
ncbi:hypothetical protein ACFLZ9_00355 [Patescibacteria group bacterium]